MKPMAVPKPGKKPCVAPRRGAWIETRLTPQGM